MAARNVYGIDKGARLPHLRGAAVTPLSDLLAEVEESPARQRTAELPRLHVGRGKQPFTHQCVVKRKP